jgi:bacillithiol biosynthesis deacetylase BshB1
MAVKLDVLALAAHPDDTELSCSGTLAALVRQGLNVGVVDLTRGEMGSRGTPELRLMEANHAADIIGLTVRDNLCLPDCNLENSEIHRRAIIEAVRMYRPDLMFINAPDDRHPDHGNAARLSIDALFYSGLVKIETFHPDGTPQEPWRPYHILHYMQDRSFEPDLVFDISDTIDIKDKAILAFGSQFNVTEPGDEPETYISSSAFFENLRARARHLGHQIGVKYGEGFKYYGGPIGLRSLDVLLSHKPKR